MCSLPLASKFLAELETEVLAKLQEAHKSSKNRRKKQSFFSLGLIHNWESVRSHLQNGKKNIYISDKFSQILSVGGVFQCKMLFLPKISNFYIFTTGKWSALFFTAAFWKVLDNFTGVGLKSIKAEISDRLLYWCSKMGSLNTLMSPACGKLSDRRAEAENWGGEE